MAEQYFPAKLDQLEPVQKFVLDQLRGFPYTERTRAQLDVAVEEIFINIVHYAYNPKMGKATVRCCVSGDPPQVTIQFLDRGKPFNPLAREEVDTTLSAEEREIGGLGILMVKKSMDAVSYAYRNGVNILTIKKGW